MKLEDIFINFSRDYMPEANFNLMNLNQRCFVNLD